MDIDRLEYLTKIAEYTDGFQSVDKHNFEFKEECALDEDLLDENVRIVDKKMVDIVDYIDEAPSYKIILSLNKLPLCYEFSNEKGLEDSIREAHKFINSINHKLEGFKYYKFVNRLVRYRSLHPLRNDLVSKEVRFIIRFEECVF